MKEALLFKSRLENGKHHLAGLVARVGVPVPHVPDVLVHQSVLYVLHYEGSAEAYYRQAKVHHVQKHSIMVDGREVGPDGKEIPPL